MQVKEKLFCHWDLVRFVSESHLQNDDGTFKILSVTDGEKLELMIFLGRDDSNSCYEVRVYKNVANNKYIPNKYDEVSCYEENDLYATFFFEDYEKAHNFIKTLSYNHPEYKKRPIRPLNSDI